MCLFLYKDQNTLAMMTYFLSYYYDCADGNYARKYNMVTTFGDYYDHLSDWFKLALIFFVMYMKKPEKTIYNILIIGFFSILLCIHLGCQEQITEKYHVSPMLSGTKMLCRDSQMIKYTRFFGSGTMFIVMLIIIYTF